MSTSFQNTSPTLTDTCLVYYLRCNPSCFDNKAVAFRKKKTESLFTLADRSTHFTKHVFIRCCVGLNVMIWGDIPQRGVY